ncbi:MAG: polyphenol oxidase family protein [Elusimicrobiota bacterium]|nr:polyphenol oxidase family protein [Elusimicrobiota bacterium]
MSAPVTSWVERKGLLQLPELSALGVPHGVTTRSLGNMKDPQRRGFAATLLGLREEPLTLKQVHGSRIVVQSEIMGQKAPLEAESKWPPEADGWIADVPGVPVGVFVADCVPLYLWSRDGKGAGVFHAGWRGLEDGMVDKAVFSVMLTRSVVAEDLFGALGPHIGPCCYAVGPEFRDKDLGVAVAERDGRLFLDMGGFVRRAWSNLRAQFGLALRDENLTTAAPCTSCGPEFHSFRRDKQDARMLALLACR